MLLDTFEFQGLLFNSNFKDSAGAGMQAYRGDLVLIEGEIADAMGRRKPPLATMIRAVLLADENRPGWKSSFSPKNSMTRNSSPAA